MKSNMEKAFMTVGTTVRVRMPSNPKVTRRAVVATLQDSSACVLCEEQNVVSSEVHATATAAATTTESHCLLGNITPVFQKDDSFEEEEEMELTVSLSEVTALLPFETIRQSEKQDNEQVSVSIWKERGDQLLQLGDGAASIPYYERGLRQSSVLQIGGSIVVKQGGHTKIADVDYFDSDEGTVDISMAESGEERTIKQQQVVLCLLQPDDDHLQERILLNLTRCYLQLAGDRKASFSTSSRRPNYLRAAVLATTLALTIATYHSNNNKDEKIMSPTHQTALVLRAQAQASLCKFNHALQDVKRLLAATNDQHREGRKLLRELETRQIDQQKKDKHLVKEICQWVHKTTSPGADGGNEDDNVPVSGCSSSSNKETNAQMALSSSAAGVATKTKQQDATTDYTWPLPTFPWLTALLILIAALLVQSFLRP